MDWTQFFVVHADVPREGPGSPQDVAWAVGLAQLPDAPVICDACCGPGGDVADLRAAAMGGRVLGVEKQSHFVAAAQARYAQDAHVQIEQGDVGQLAQHAQAPFDMIWCAGALYFWGLQDGLALMHKALKPGGVLAFSEPCYFTDAPGDQALAFWEGYDTGTAGDIVAALDAAGFDALGQRKVSDEGWEAYYAPLEARIAKLRDGASDALTEMLDMCAKEAEDWRAVRAQTGYMLSVARKRPA